MRTTSNEACTFSLNGFALSGLVSGERARPLSSSMPVARRLIRLRRAYSAGVAEVIVIVTVGIVLPSGIVVEGAVGEARLSTVVVVVLTGLLSPLLAPTSGASSVSILVIPELFASCDCCCCFEGNLMVKQFDSDSVDACRSKLEATDDVVVEDAPLLPAIEVVVVFVTAPIVSGSSRSIEPLESLDVVEAVSKLFIILLKSFSEESVAFFAKVNSTEFRNVSMVG